MAGDWDVCAEPESRGYGENRGANTERGGRKDCRNGEWRKILYSGFAAGRGVYGCARSESER